MKVSSIKTILPVAAAGLMALATSCSTATERAEKYMEETNRTQAELNAIKSGNVQSKLDSIAYRDIFMGTEAAKDSANLAEFNKIAARLRVPDDMYFSETSKYLDDKFSVEWKDIEVVNDETGRPSVVINNKIIEKIDMIDVSLSHCKQYAVANTVVIWKLID